MGGTLRDKVLLMVFLCPANGIHIYHCSMQMEIMIVLIHIPDLGFFLYLSFILAISMITEVQLLCMTLS